MADTVHTQDSFYKPTPQYYKGPPGEVGVVDKVLLTSNEENHFLVKALIRHTRRPEVGDKFSSKSRASRDTTTHPISSQPDLILILDLDSGVN